MEINAINTRKNLKFKISRFFDNKKVQLVKFNTVSNYNIPNQFKLFINKKDNLIERTIDLKVNPITNQYEEHSIDYVFNGNENVWIEINDFVTIYKNFKISYELIVKELE